MLWGYALVWAREFLQLDTDPLLARLKFLAAHGLQTTGVGLDAVAERDDAARAALFQYLADADLSLSVYIQAPYFGPDLDAARRALDRQIALLDAYAGDLRTRLAITTGGAAHRFTREPSLGHQLERLAALLPAPAAACERAGIAFGIENHGDYYCSDLVPLCRATPGLGIFLDTGNVYLIGEAPLPAYRAAAPYVVGTHFKDHHVRPRPEARPLSFEVGPAVLGEGDVPLRECYQLLLEQAPNPRNLIMEIELIPPGDRPPLQSFEQSLAFVRSLQPPR